MVQERGKRWVGNTAIARKSIPELRMAIPDSQINM